MKRPQKKEEFDKWYSESGSGDPWGCDAPHMISRYEASLEFMRQYVPLDFNGVFAEMGAFRGDFTARLSASYPFSHIIANDISSVAIESARERLHAARHVRFDLSDMATFSLPAELRNKPVILLLLESLYYLPKPEQENAIKHLLSEMPNAKTVFVSGPLTDRDYFEEKILRRRFVENGLRCVSAKTLNTNDRFRALFSYNGDWLIKVLDRAKDSEKVNKVLKMGRRHTEYLIRDLALWRIDDLNRREKAAHMRLDTDAGYRKRYAHQVIFCFQR